MEMVSKSKELAELSYQLMQERARPSGTELWSEPRTTWRAPGREATVSGGLEILEVLFNSCLGE